MDNEQKPMVDPPENQETPKNSSNLTSTPDQTPPATPSNDPNVDPPTDSEAEITPFKPQKKPANNKKKWLIASAILLAVIIAAVLWMLLGHKKSATENSNTSAVNSQSATLSRVPASKSTQGLQLDPNKDYGNKYKDGILPVGDGKYSTTGAKKGYVYACSQYAQNLKTDSGGAGSRGPWFTDNNTEYNINKKLHVRGSVMWTADFSNKLSGNTRTIITNDLPTHPTGIFPIQSSDPAYQYDRNPNSIKGQTLTFVLNADPAYNANPNCMGGEVGVMLTGVALFSAFDAGGRDAGAWEIQDNCEGHPQSEGLYHYHTLSSCIKNVSVHTVIGYALDGFPITGPQVGANNILTTNDLDECHGIVSQIKFNGKNVTMYHYVMTQDFPYSVSCYRGKAIQPPGMQSGSQQSQSQSQPAQTAPTKQTGVQPRQQLPPQMPPPPYHP